MSTEWSRPSLTVWITTMHANAATLERAAAPFLRYRNLAAAISWLCTTLGFKRHLIVEDKDGGVRYAQLALYSAMIALAPANGAGFDERMVRPDEVQDPETQTSLFFVVDVDAHYARATSLGADIVLHVSDIGDGGRGYSCRDPEGNIWSFRECELWGHLPVERRPRWGALITTLSASLSVLMIGSTVALGYLHAAGHGAASVRRAPLASEQSAETPIKQRLHDALMQARTASEAAERVTEESRAQIARQQHAKEVAESLERQARDQAATERSLRLAAEHDRADALAQLTALASQKEQAEIAARNARDLASKERRLRLAAEHSREVVQRRYATRRTTLAGRRPSFTLGW
jgi:uncharacterized glyoxalase superfamily protein PhnB